MTNDENYDCFISGTYIKLPSYIKLMHVLGFIHIKKRSAAEEAMITEVWKLVGGTIDNKIKAENLLVLMAGVLNI